MSLKHEPRPNNTAFGRQTHSSFDLDVAKGIKSSATLEILYRGH